MARACPIALTLTVLCTGPIAAQAMSGLYTLDSTGSGSRNFKSFIEATYNLSRSGVNGAVTIEVASGAYPGTDRWTTTPVPGASATNRVTFRSKTKHGATIPYTMSPTLGGYALPVKYITFDGFRFQGSAQYSNNAGLRLYNNVAQIEIRNCHFDGAYLLIQDCVNVDVHHCLFAYLFSTTTARGRHIDIQNCDYLVLHHNEFRMAECRTAIKMYHYVSKRARTKIYNNLFWGAPRGSEPILDFYGVQETQIDHNTFVIFATNGWGAEVLEINGRLGVWNDIRNNIFYSEGKYALLSITPHLPYIHFFNRNIYWIPNGYLVRYPRPNQSPITYGSLTPWQIGTKQDPVGIQADPGFRNIKTTPYDLRPRAGSAAGGRAINTQFWITDDFEGTVRFKPTTIGAYESFADFDVFGKGCAGTANKIPVLGYSGSLKHGSTTFALELSNVATKSNRSFLAVGASNSTWGPVPLPYALGGGCSLLVSLDIVLSTLTIFGKSTLRLGIPGATNLRGTKVHFQWGVVDPAAGGIGLAMTNGATLTL
jgi:hypothetical protein